jgi:transposase InsO family protein
MTELSVKEAEKLRTALQQNQEVLGPEANKPWGYLTGEAKLGLRIRWKANQEVLPEPLQSDLSTHNGEQFVQLITLLYANPDQKTDGSAQVQLEQSWKDVDFSYINYNEIETRVLTATKLITANAMDPAQQKDTIVRIVKSAEAFNKDKPHADECKKILERLKGHQENFDMWSAKLLGLLVSNRQKVKELRDCGIKVSHTNIDTKKRPFDNSKFKPGDSNQAKRLKLDATTHDVDRRPKELPCTACGRNNHKFAECNFRKQGHPDINLQMHTPWQSSNNGIAWKKKGKDVLPGNLTLSGAPFAFTYSEKPQKGNTLFATRSFTADGHTLKCGIIVNDTPPIHREVNCLIDTGALTQNYISPHIANWLTSQGTKVKRVSGARSIQVCSVHECTIEDSNVVFTLAYLNECTNTIDQITIDAWVMPNLPYDIIIGRPTLTKHRLLLDNKISLSGEKFNFKYIRDEACQCCTKPKPSSAAHASRLKLSLDEQIHTPILRDPAIIAVDPHEQAQKRRLFNNKAAREIVNDINRLAKERVRETVSLLQTEMSEGRLRAAAPLHAEAEHAGRSDTVTAPLHYLYLLQGVDAEFANQKYSRDSKHTIAQYLFLTHGERLHKDALLDPIDDDDEIDYTRTEPPWEQETPEGKPFQFPQNSDKTEEQAVRNILDTYDETFQASLNTRPAVLDPMVLKVNDAAWKVAANRRAARFVSEMKRAEIQRQVMKMLELRLIRPSQNAEKSQVVLARKPDGTWRFCIDYRELNTHTQSMGWPIPNIPQMLQRIGMRQPKYFAVMDLTMGFYQAPLAEESRHYTTFTTWMGTYEWLRVAMGLKGAPSWFQQQLETKVLGGLIHQICELYIDDLIIYADTFEEYLENIRKVLERFKAHNITVSPKKCQFLMQEIQYVGYTINGKGISFSREKKQEILDFPVPRTAGQLKQFMGLAEQFHPHVRGFADLARPLHRHIDGYRKRQKQKPLDWDEGDIAAYQAMQAGINAAPTLFFPEPDKEIFLETDASDYGIGAYLYQMDDKGNKYPIAFISKNLTGAQLNWSVPEKEAYGIFFALQKLEYLLRDVHFILKTDHKNLTYINFGNSAKILRWKLMIQEYDFDIEHVAGEENIVADAFSRLMAMPKDSDIDAVLNHVNILYTKEEEKQFKEKFNILADLHNSTVGHFGVSATMDRLKQRNLHWPDMHEHVKRFVKQCPCCQKMSFLKHPIEHHPFVIASYEPMQKLAVDTAGPFEKDIHGNTHVCVITDCFSRFTMLIPTLDATAQSAARALLQWVGLFGAPKEILSDMGTQFINHLIDDLLKLLHTNKLDILAGVHQQNSIVERRIKELNRHIRNILYHTKVKSYWSDALPLVQRIMNAQRLIPTGTSPAQIIFGNALNLDSGILLSTNTDNETPHSKARRLSEWTAKMLKLQNDIISIAQRTQSKTHEDYFNKFSDERTEFPINSYVLVNYGDKTPPTKFHAYWRGPYRVVHQDDEDKNRYTVQNLVTNKLEDFPVHQMKPYLDNGIDLPEQVAMTDDPRLHIVEKILSHTGNRTKPATLQFEVKWEDLPVTQTSMETYNAIKHTGPLHEYLTKLGGEWQALIPIEYTNEGEHYSETHKSKRQRKEQKTSRNKRAKR